VFSVSRGSIKLTQELNSYMASLTYEAVTQAVSQFNRLSLKQCHSSTDCHSSSVTVQQTVTVCVC